MTLPRIEALEREIAPGAGVTQVCGWHKASGK